MGFGKPVGPRPAARRCDDRLVAGIKAAAPDRTPRQIAAQLEAMCEHTPRRGIRWHRSSVKHLPGQAARLGLTGITQGAGSV